MTDKVLGMLGLMRKASALCPGEDSASEVVLAGKARLLLLPSDTGEKKKERAERYTEDRSCIIVELPYTERELSGAVGTGGCTMAAVTDLGFADALMRALAEINPERYGSQAEMIRNKKEKLKKRKAEKPGIRSSRPEPDKVKPGARSSRPEPDKVKSGVKSSRSEPASAKSGMKSNRSGSALSKPGTGRKKPGAKADCNGTLKGKK